MKKGTSLLLAALVASSMFSTTAMADPKKGQKFYLKKLKACKKDGLKTGHSFALKNDRASWAKLEADGKLKEAWIENCPHGAKKIKKMKAKHIKNLYDFCYKYASDGDVPSCG